MNPRKISRQQLRSACDQVGPDDGLDPRFDRKPGGGNRQNPHKLQQLCAEVARTLGETLAGCANDVLRDLLVTDVLPAPSSARLVVRVTLSPGASGLDSTLVLQHLHSAAGLLRSEVAAAIRRRKAPDLVFEVVCR